MPLSEEERPDSLSFFRRKGEVILSPFFLSKYEMTQGQWLRFVGRNPSQYGPNGYYASDWNRAGLEPDLAYPVECVSWNDCTEVLGRLGLELPSEAQWEYGARAGTSTVWWTGNEKKALPEAGNVVDSYAKAHGSQAWTNFELDLDDGNTAHARIGSYRANAFGLHDVIGNLTEWCRDGYQRDFYRRGSKRDPLWDPSGPTARVERGGDFFRPASTARSAFRAGDAQWAAVILVGVRPARRITP